MPHPSKERPLLTPMLRVRAVQAVWMAIPLSAPATVWPGAISVDWAGLIDASGGEMAMK